MRRHVIPVLALALLAPACDDGQSERKQPASAQEKEPAAGQQRKLNSNDETRKTLKGSAAQSPRSIPRR
jgi:hypothetical protein